MTLKSFRYTPAFNDTPFCVILRGDKVLQEAFKLIASGPEIVKNNITPQRLIQLVYPYPRGLFYNNYLEEQLDKICQLDPSEKVHEMFLESLSGMAYDTDETIIKEIASILGLNNEDANSVLDNTYLYKWGDPHFMYFINKTFLDNKVIPHVEMGYF